ncbi:MAG: ammonium transporter, partial [Thiotrichales bacterium]|nr:ammonium transporter [Thiotrichales bacterium]
LMGVSVAVVGSVIVYGLIKKFVGLRLTQEEEYNGADLSLHRIHANPPRDDF